MNASDAEDILVHMGSDGRFNVVCPLCGKSKVIDPPSHVTSLKMSHCGKNFQLQLNRRKAFRKKSNGSGVAEKDSQRFNIWIKDLSLGGICFEAKTDIFIGKTLRLISFFLIEGDLRNPIQMEIVRRQGNAYSAKFHGLQDGYAAKKAIYLWLHK